MRLGRKLNTEGEWKAEYKIDNEYGLLECTFYPEQTMQYLYLFFSPSLRKPTIILVR